MRAGHAARMRLRADRALRAVRGIPERRQRVIARVALTAIGMPEWARRHAVRHMASGEDWLWLPLRIAQMLERLDREAGGTPTMIEAEYRYCPNCRRPLVGEDAENRRRLEASGATAAKLACGDGCVTAQRDRRWKSRTGSKRELVHAC